MKIIDKEGHISFPKIPRWENIWMTITEKLDGTNSVIWKSPEGEFKFGSRNRWLGAGLDDNQGFYQFCQDNIDYLNRLSPGYHYGEFIGPGINGNRYELTEKKLYFFNPKDGQRFGDSLLIGSVPLLNRLPLSLAMREDEHGKNSLDEHFKRKSTLNPEVKAEGIMLYFEELGRYIKIIYDK